MIIFPAIDIKDGCAVRLSKGDFATAEQVADDPLAKAFEFKEAGAEWLHMVDLDGALNSNQPNKLLFIEIARQTGLKLQIGGGIRDMKSAAAYLDNGIERVIVGSAAVKNPRLVADLVREYGERIVVGIDAKKGMVQTDGWTNASKTGFLSLAKTMQEIGVQTVIYTDISHDGMLDGPNLGDIKKLKNMVKMNIIASGGIAGIKDIIALKQLSLYGAICGKSLYKGTLSLEEAIRVVAAPATPGKE